MDTSGAAIFVLKNKSTLYVCQISCCFLDQDTLAVAEAGSCTFYQMLLISKGKQNPLVSDRIECLTLSLKFLL